MSTALALSNDGRQLQAALMDQLGTELGRVLPPTMRPERLILTIVQCGERNRALYDANPHSLQLAALSMATLNLECDGFTGQGYLLPFSQRGGGKIVQPVIGYKGYNTLAARNGITISGSVVRDGDRFEYELGTSPVLRHTPMLRGNKNQIVAAYAIAQRPGMAPIVRVMGYDELLAVKQKAPGAKKTDSPWNDPAVGFPAMCEKTVKRRLARDVPQGWVPVGDTLEGCWDRGQAAFVMQEEEGPIVTLDREYADAPPADRNGTELGEELGKRWVLLMPGDRPDHEHNGPTRYVQDFSAQLRRCAKHAPDLLEGFWEANQDGRSDLGLADPQKHEQLEKLYKELLAEV